MEAEACREMRRVSEMDPSKEAKRALEKPP